MSPWQPIETAPKDGTVIDVMDEDGEIRKAQWLPEEDEWILDGRMHYFSHGDFLVMFSRWKTKA